MIALVSVDTSTLKLCALVAMTVRHTPLMAIESPSFGCRFELSVKILFLKLLTSAISRISPVNIKSRFLNHLDIIAKL